jgi:hypothetical protein
MPAALRFIDEKDAVALGYQLPAEGPGSMCTPSFSLARSMADGASRGLSHLDDGEAASH